MSVLNVACRDRRLISHRNLARGSGGITWIQKVDHTSTSRHKSFASSGGKRLAGERPFEGFGHCLIEVTDKVQEPLT